MELEILFHLKLVPHDCVLNNGVRYISELDSLIFNSMYIVCSLPQLQEEHFGGLPPLMNWQQL